MRTLSFTGWKCNMPRPSILLSVCMLCLIVGLTACGGGGSDDEFIGAAVINVSISPSNIDTGDRARLKITISDVHSNGIALKILFPDGLEYVDDSAELTVDDDSNPIDPAINMLSSDGVYLVFYLPQTLFGEEGLSDGELDLELEGTSEVRNGEIEVDADVDDPTVDNADEFDVDDPEFLSEDSTEIEVEE
jgi:hypothetical protein